MGQWSTRDLQALDLVPEAVVVVDDDRTIRFVNDRAGALLGLGRGTVGSRLDDVVDLRDETGHHLGALLDEVPPGADRLPERILRLALPGGRHRPVAAAGRVEGEALILTFRHAGRREQVDAARSDLVATVSHEIRSPLTSVKGFTRTLLSKWDRFGDEQKRAMLETVNDDADRVTRLLRELLDVSRIDAGRVQLHPQPVDVPEIVRRVVERSRHRPEAEGRDITLDVTEPVADIWADPDKIEQIVTNLVENALQYAPDSPVRVSVEQIDGAVHLAVADDGPGIPPDQVRRVFEKFGRGRNNRRSGTGLGLYITRGLAEAHGGRVRCVSEPDDGTTFHVELPLEPESPPR